MSALTPPYPETAFAAPRRQAETLKGYLIARRPSKAGSARDDFYVYDLVIDNEVIVRESRTPEFDACRVLVARGIFGKLAIYDSGTEKLRYTVDIEGGAKLTVIENRKSGPRFARWQPYQGPSKIKKIPG